VSSQRSAFRCVVIAGWLVCRPAIQQAIINGLIIGSVYYKMGLDDFAGKLACFFLLVTSVTFSNMVRVELQWGRFHALSCLTVYL
jgi:hypothetical protein